MNDLFNKLTPGEIALLVAVIGLGGAICGAAIAASSMLLAAHLNRRAQNRKHYRELGVAVGRSKFDQSVALAQQLANTTGKFVPVPPLDAHLIHGIRLMEIISDSSLSAKQIGERIAALTDFSKTVTDMVKSNH